jgi:hypothetical protein
MPALSLLTDQVANVNLFLESRLHRVGKRPVTRSDVAYQLSSAIINADKDREYSDATFRAHNLATAGDELEEYLKRDGAIDTPEISIALGIIDSKLKEYFDILEGALNAEVANA